ncbi:MAG TPA: glycosyltransferase family 4 protein [Terriglobales bacterium]|nr:glycosyltransferase family 4 protein [Terriglobales bacterium]
MHRPVPNPAPRVLHIVPALFGAGGLYGGAERYAQELSRAMARVTPTRLVGFGRPAARRRDGDLEIVTLRNQLPGWRFATSPASLALWPHLAWADVIHCHQIYTMATSLALLYGRARHKPVYVTDHAGGGWSLQSRFHLDPWFAGRLWVSGFSRGERPALPGDRIIWGGVDAQDFHPAAAAPEGERPALYVGRLLPVKSVDLLIRAVDATTPVEILGPAYDAGYAATLHQLAQGKRVRFRPPAEGEALVRAYQNALCVVLPGTEMFSLTLLEAMACATPVICVRSSGMVEALEDGVTGFIIPSGDERALAEKIGWLRQYPAAARAMGEAGRRRVLRDLTWTAVAGRCLEAYRSPNGVSSR